jgi:3-hydroxyisobutyrate dehydrogenase-like beta-hydroxyacid dehydrogenase
VAFEAVRDVLETIGRPWSTSDRADSGQIVKMVNRMTSATITCIANEAMAFAAMQGVDIKKAAESMNRSYLLEVVRVVESGDLGSGGGMAQGAKDIDCVVEEGDALPCVPARATAIHEVHNIARRRGYGAEGAGALYRCVGRHFRYYVAKRDSKMNKEAVWTWWRIWFYEEQ